LMRRRCATRMNAHTMLAPCLRLRAHRSTLMTRLPARCIKNVLRDLQSSLHTAARCTCHVGRKWWGYERSHNPPKLRDLIACRGSLWNVLRDVCHFCMRPDCSARAGRSPFRPAPAGRPSAGRPSASCARRPTALSPGARRPPFRPARPSASCARAGRPSAPRAPAALMRARRPPFRPARAGPSASCARRPALLRDCLSTHTSHTRQLPLRSRRITHAPAATPLLTPHTRTGCLSTHRLPLRSRLCLRLTHAPAASSPLTPRTRTGCLLSAHASHTRRLPSLRSRLCLRLAHLKHFRSGFRVVHMCGRMSTRLWQRFAAKLLLRTDFPTCI
jgi:hypothetical protein